MFPIDSLPAQYFEEREAAETAKRLARLQQQNEQIQRSASQTPTLPELHGAVAPHTSLPSSSSSLPYNKSPSSSSNSIPFAPPLPPALLHHHQQRPPLHRPESSGFLGNIFQGFVRAASQSPRLPNNTEPPLPPNASRSGASTPAAPICVQRRTTMTQAELDAWVAEKKRDADIVSFCPVPTTRFSEWSRITIIIIVITAEN